MFLVMLTFVVATIFVTNAEYSRRANAEGWLVSTAGVVRISTPRPATVSGISVQQGSEVSINQALILLSTDAVMAGGDTQSDQVLAQIHLEMTELEIQVALTDKQFELETKNLERQMSGFNVELASLAAGLRGQDQRIALAQQKLQQLVDAANGGAVTGWEVIKQRELVSELDQELLRLQQGELRSQRARDVVRSQLASIPGKEKMQRSLLNTRQRQLRQQTAEHEARRLSLVASPVDGVVDSIQVSIGDVAVPGQLMMTVLPANTNLAAEIYVPSRAAGFIQPGQVVRLSYDAFPRQEFGTFAGRVRRVSDYVLLPRDIPQTFSIREATYKVEIEIEDSTLLTQSGASLLRPGMMLTAEIVLEKRNLVDWLLEPLRLYRGSVA